MGPGPLPRERGDDSAEAASKASSERWAFGDAALSAMAMRCTAPSDLYDGKGGRASGPDASVVRGGGGEEVNLLEVLWCSCQCGH